jgi:acetoacetyl-CoA synthetase
VAGDVAEGELLWKPGEGRRQDARISAFARWLRDDRGVVLGDSYRDLHEWSTRQLDEFWSAFTDWAGVRWHDRPRHALTWVQLPGARWFSGGTLNYAEHLLTPLTPLDVSDATAVIGSREDGREVSLTWAELRSRVAAVQQWLLRQGIEPGDRVVAVVPNAPEALIAMLAVASIGAVWSSCSPDFGARGIADRFAQVDPVVLIAVDGYRYNGKPYDIRVTVEALRAELPTLRATVLIPWLDEAAGAVRGVDGATPWGELVADATPGTEPSYRPVAPDHPLWILYSSGTTGLPKPIVHGHGGITVEHVKQLALHLDLGPDDTFCWFSTTGWMMWNLLVSGLAVGSTILLYDGSPTHPDPLALWRLADRHRITCLGVSAPFIQACQRMGLRPREDTGLDALRTLGSTGAPLPPEGYGWVYEAVAGDDLMLSSLSGGTDVCTAFVGGVPTLPVRAGEIPAALLGCDVQAFGADGCPVPAGELGELVITAPMPSMPVGFWNDPDGSRLRAAYFEDYPGVWRHGDWVRITEEGSFVIYGRSDSTLNRGGVRMGTSEFYRLVDEVSEVSDSLVVDTSAVGVDGRLLLFVTLADGADLGDVTERLRGLIRSQLSPRHVPDAVVAVPAIPRTLNGKKCEVPVKRILAGVPVEQAVAAGALADPRALQPFLDYAAELARSTQSH